VFDAQKIFDSGCLFPGWEVLHDLLLEFSNLFQLFHYKLKPRDSDALQRIGELEGLPIDLGELLGGVPAYGRIQAQKWMETHDYVIQLLAKYLQDSKWPADDAAVEQELIGTDHFGAALACKVIIMKSKHVLEITVE
jgi:hypothetical protein